MPLKVIARKSMLHGMGLFAARDLAVRQPAENRREGCECYLR